jgi:hypothetical protein
MKQTKIFENTNDPEFDEIIEFNLKTVMQLAHYQQSDQDDVPLINLGQGPRTSSSLKETLTEAEELKIVSKIRIFLLVMDYDKVEKSDLIGKIEMVSRFEDEKRRSTNSSSSNKRLSSRSDFSKFKKGVTLDQSCSDSCNFSVSKNWYDIFDRPNHPIYCSFQIKSLN